MDKKQHRCKATTQTGSRCKNHALSGASFCHIHQGRKEMIALDSTSHLNTWRYSMKDKFTYMGKQVNIKMNEENNQAKLFIEDKEFEIMLHTEGKPEDNYIKLWMCKDTYTMTESPELMAKHFIEYWHQYI